MVTLYYLEIILFQKQQYLQMHFFRNLVIQSAVIYKGSP